MSIDSGASHFSKSSLVREDKQQRFLPLTQMMTHVEADRVQACIQEIAAILYRNTAAEDLVNLESIEKTVRQQMLDHVSPNIALFLSSKSLKLTEARPDK